MTFGTVPHLSSLGCDHNIPRYHVMKLHHLLCILDRKATLAMLKEIHHRPDDIFQCADKDLVIVHMPHRLSDQTAHLNDM